MQARQCRVCLQPFMSGDSRKVYCSVACKDKGKPSKNRGCCVVCGGGMERRSHSAGVQAHDSCRSDSPLCGSVVKAFSGCQCVLCGETRHRVKHLANARQAAIKSLAASRRPCCVACGDPLSRISGSVAPLHKRCKRSFIPDYQSKREFVLGRDSGMCQLCFEPVDLDAHWQSDWAATLDHVVPRSLGGGHEVENLRLAHRWCNSVRRNDVSVDEYLLPV